MRKRATCATNILFRFLTPAETVKKAVLLIDQWENQEAIDAHHASPMMETISKLREKYDLHMSVERFVPGGDAPESDESFIKDK